MIGTSHCKSASCLVCCLWVFCRWRYKVFNFHVTSHDDLIKRGCEFVGGSSLCYVIDGHWSNASGNAIYLVCHMTLQSHVLGGSNFISGSSSWYITILTSVVTMVIVVVIYVFSLSRNQASPHFYDYNNHRSPSR